MRGKSLSDAIQSLFGFKTTFNINPKTDNVDATVTKILDINPQRVGLVIINLSGNSVYVSPKNDVSSTKGIYLAANGGSMSMVWDRDFELCSSDWYGISSAANQPIYVLETLSL